MDDKTLRQREWMAIGVILTMLLIPLAPYAFGG